MHASGETIFQHVSVLMGGVSREREVSLRSGMAIAEGLRQAGRDVVEIDVRGRELEMPGWVEGVFIALHGEFGEDGEVQDILERRGVPYTGSGPEGSRLAFNKKLAKNLFLSHHIPTPRFEILRAGLKRTLDLPVVVKPIRQGSSLGVHKVSVESEWDRAFADSISYDGEVIVEEFIDGRELTVGVVCGDVLPVIEIRAPDNNYDYRAKYSPGLTQYAVPAQLDERALRECREMTLESFRILKCRGFGRADLRMSSSGRVYMLEVNTIPGFTETSLLPKAALSAGCGFPQLCDRIMQSAALDSG